MGETRPKQWMLSSSSAARGRRRPPRRLKRCRSRQGAFMRPDTVVDVVSASASTAFTAEMLMNTRAERGAPCRTTVEGFARPIARRQWSRGPAGAADHKSVRIAQRGAAAAFFFAARDAVDLRTCLDALGLPAGRVQAHAHQSQGLHRSQGLRSRCLAQCTCRLSTLETAILT